MNIKNIIIDTKNFQYLEKRQLIQQFQKAKSHLLSGNTKATNFKLREPKKEKIYAFRINKQFRVYGKILGETFVVIKISNHQK